MIGEPEAPRIKAGIWIKMALRLGDIGSRPGVVLRRGDEDAGGVLVVLRARSGVCVLSQIRAGDGDVGWLRATGPSPVEQSVADAYIERQIGFDPDLWVLEFESPDLLPPFGGSIA